MTLTNSKNSFTEALLFTHRGLSGPSSLQLSNYWNTGESFKIDFFPSQDLTTYLKDKKKAQPKVLLRTLLNEFTAKVLYKNYNNLYGQSRARQPLVISVMHS